MSEPDFLIAGGGIAGAATAALLASDGRRVTLVERSTGPHHKVCGEFLSGEALHYLSSMGLDVWSMGALPIRKVRLAADGVIAESPLPFEAASLSRRTLDEALLHHAQSCGAHILRGRAVERLEHQEGSWQMELSDGCHMRAPQAMLATGKHLLRGHMRGPGRQSDLVAWKLHLELSAEQQRMLQDTVEVVLFPGGYLGLQPTDAGKTNLCLLMTRKMLRRLGDWGNILRHLTSSSRLLRERLHGARECFPRPLTLSNIPYGYVRRETPEGLWAMGDQTAVIPSFSGDGMAIALHTAHQTADACRSGTASICHTMRMHRELSAQVSRATLLSQMMVHAPAAAAVAGFFPSILTLFAKSTRIADRFLSHIDQRSIGA